MVVATRAAFVAEVLLAAAATGALAVCALAAHGPPAPAARVQLGAMPNCTRDVVAVTAPPAPIHSCAVDPAQYRAKHFAAAATALPIDCTGERELMQQLDRVWLTGMDRGAAWTERFDALIHARELDLLFGGDHADEIDAAMRAVVSRAAVYFIASDDATDARRAVDTATLLGVHTQNLDSVAHQLDQRGF